jgi:hypothetical protein
LTNVIKMVTSRLSYVLGTLCGACQHVKMYRAFHDRDVPNKATVRVTDAPLRRGNFPGCRSRIVHAGQLANRRVNIRDQGFYWVRW